MTSHLFIYNICPEFAELLDKHPITTHEFQSGGMDCLNKMFFWVSLKFFILIKR